MQASKIINAVGIVSEYNPFHKGHLYHLQQTKLQKQLPVIAIMSGSIMQRGEPAFLDKWTRARLAVENGVDLVLELPAVWSLRSAEYFAKGATACLAATGCVSYLSCGAEHPELDFASMARYITSTTAQEFIKDQLAQGASYAVACAKALEQHSVPLSSPNDILALEYTKALLDTDIQPLYIKRVVAAYNATEIKAPIASATAIRQEYSALQMVEMNNNLNQNRRTIPDIGLNGSDNAQLPSWQATVPDNVLATLQQVHAGYNEELLWQLCSYRLRLLSAAKIAACTTCSEGLENVLKAAAACSSLKEFLSECSKKRYPASRLRRLLLQLLLGKSRAMLEQTAPAYLRVLAFNDNGRQLLKQMQETATLPIITKLGKHPEQDQSPAFCEQLELDLAATELTSLLSNDNHSVARDFFTSPTYVKKSV